LGEVLESTSDIETLLDRSALDGASTIETINQKSIGKKSCAVAKTAKVSGQHSCRILACRQRLPRTARSL
jgi:hypothetical protein